MMNERDLRSTADEIEGLRSRVAELERQLFEARWVGPSPDLTAASEALGEPPGSTKSMAERALDGFFDQSLVMMFIADLVEGRFLRINRKVCEVIGASEKEILESSFLDRVHPDDRLRTMREMERLVAGEKSIHFRNRHRDANGDYRVFDWTSVADPDGELCFAMAIEVAEL